jgi:hypothetical protein
MNLKLMSAMVIIVASTPALGQAQRGNPPAAPKPTQAEVQKVVQGISGDKTKLQAYCEMAKLSQQMEQADERKDSKALESLEKRADDLAQKLGPDYGKMMDGLEQVDPTSNEGKQLAAVLGSLDKQCK